MWSGKDQLKLSMKGPYPHPESIFGSAAIGFGKAADTHGMKDIMKDAGKDTGGKKDIGKMPRVDGDGTRGIGDQHNYLEGCP
jgi:hypothetical protein